MAGTRAIPPVRAVTEWFADLVWPPLCATCGERGAWVCARCFGTIALNQPPWCPRCGVDPCRCGTLPEVITVARSVGLHIGWLRDSVHALKYEGESARAGHLGALMAPLLAELVVHEPDVIVVPVALHSRRRRERGFDQCLLLATGAVRALGRPHVRVVPQAVRRVRATRQQVGLTPSERAGNVAGAFEADPRLVAGRPVILIDDVLTTGATVAACAVALREAGARDVGVVTCSRSVSADTADAGS